MTRNELTVKYILGYKPPECSGHCVFM